jgi:HAD superfamily hydrolase (TIGR01509 family)
MPLRALLFDLDGTLTESDSLHAVAYIAVMADHGLTLDEATYRSRMSGRPNIAIVEEFLPQLSRPEALALIDDKEARFRALATRLEPLPGLERTLAWAAERDLALAVVTNAPRENLDFALAALALTDTFPVKVSPEEVANAKPDPEPYLLALSRLGVPADEALAFEDTPSGVRSAVDAGLRVVGLTTGQPAERLRAQGSVLEIADYHDGALRGLLEGAA